MKICLICKKQFEKKRNESKNEWEKKKYCSNTCYKQVRIAQLKSKEFRLHNSILKTQNPTRYWLGKKRPEFSPEWKKHMARNPWNKDKKVPQNSGENHFAWKGDDVGYDALHDWVAKELGRPRKCEHCKDLTKKRYEWANVSKEYKRDLSDWIRLCKSCHNKYDETGKKTWIKRRSKISSI